ncbi:MAG: SOS response-associated peptidase [Pseudomonadota bacterium]|nr:SOS response-associated peptidase [Pseudomonadota bacterium]
MCSRYFLDADGNIIAYTFQVPVHDRIRKRFNIAPTQEAPVIRAGAGGAREVAMLRWGLVPFWAKDLKVGTKMINARSEGVETKPSFRAAVRERRCVVPATGFFEWQGEPGRKQPFAITLPGQSLIAFAGLWERWKPAEGEPLETFTIVTTDANEAIARIHDRMPVILPMDAIDTWLTAPPDEARALLKPYAGPVELRMVNKYVSNVNNEGPGCLGDPSPAWTPPQQQSLL